MKKKCEEWRVKSEVAGCAVGLVLMCCMALAGCGNIAEEQGEEWRVECGEAEGQSEEWSVESGVSEDKIINRPGKYVISDTVTDGQIVVDVGSDDEVTLVLDGADITSSDSAAIYIRSGDCTVELADGSVNQLSSGSTFAEIDTDVNIDGTIFARDDLTITGEGTLEITSPAGHGIVCKDDLTIEGGNVTIGAEKKGIQGKDSVTVTGGCLTVTKSTEGIESKVVTITGGDIDITSSDDGINATDKDAQASINNKGDRGPMQYLEGVLIDIQGGTLKVQAGGDGLDSNGDITISGGTADINSTGQADEAIDCNGTYDKTGGEVATSQKGMGQGDGMRGGFPGDRPDCPDGTPDGTTGATPQAPEGGFDDENIDGGRRGFPGQGGGEAPTDGKLHGGPGDGWDGGAGLPGDDSI